MKLFERTPKQSGTANPRSELAAKGKKAISPTPLETASPDANEGQIKKEEKRILLVSPNSSSFEPIHNAFRTHRANWLTQAATSLPEAARLAEKNPFDVLVCDGTALAAADPATLGELSKAEPVPFLIRWCSQTDAAMPNSKLRFETLDTSSSPEQIHTTFQKIFRIGDWMADPDVKRLIKKMERIPTIPALYNQVTAELSSPKGSLEFAGKLIGKDPGMTLRVLQMVNSSEFGMARSITEPVEAVLFLGSERVKALILAANVFHQFEKDTCPGFSHPSLWQHSMATATFATAIAKAQGSEKQFNDAAFTAGLLHDIGRLLLAGNVPNDYTNVLQQADRRKVSLAQVELEAFGATHAELGACVLGSWGLPLPVLESVAWHHVPTKSDDEAFTLLTAVHLANSFENERQEEKDGRRRNHVDIQYIERLQLLDKCNIWRGICGCTTRCSKDERLLRIAIQQELKNLAR